MKLACDHDTENSVVDALGVPDVKLSGLDNNETLWVYNDRLDGYQRLSLVFDENKKLQGIMWLVRENESEIHLENSKRLFKNANFVAQNVTWENSHAAPDERFYSDDKKGISITFRKTRKEVESIGWFNPNAKHSNDRKPALKYEL